MRDYIKRLIDDGHPMDLQLIYDMGDFVTRKAAAAWMQRGIASGEFPVVGQMKNTNGKWDLNVVCGGWQPKKDNLRHEVMGTRYRVLFPLFTFERGHRIGKCYPDLLQADGESRWEIEIDCGTIRNREKFKTRIKKHKDCDSDLLVVIAARTNNEGRLKQVLEWIDGIRDGVFVTTLERLEKHGGHARVFEFPGRLEQPMKCVPLPVSPSFQDYTQDTPEVATGSEDSEVNCDCN